MVGQSPRRTGPQQAKAQLFQQQPDNQRAEKSAGCAHKSGSNAPGEKGKQPFDGTAIKDPKNVLVPIGTRISEVVEFCGGYAQPPKKMLMGGPMMGIALTDDSLPIWKQNKTSLPVGVLGARSPEPSAGIRCRGGVRS